MHGDHDFINGPLSFRNLMRIRVAPEERHVDGSQVWCRFPTCGPGSMTITEMDSGCKAENDSCGKKDGCTMECALEYAENRCL